MDKKFYIAANWKMNFTIDESLNLIDEIIKRHSILEKELSSGEIDKKLFAEKSKEYSDLNEIVYSAKKYASYKNDKIDKMIKMVKMI